MKSIVRVAAMSNVVLAANPKATLEYLIKDFDEVAIQTPDIIVFPAYALSGASCSSLFENPLLSESCLEQLEILSEYTKDYEGYIIIGLPYLTQNKVTCAFAVLQRGKIVSFPASEQEVFECGDLTFSISDTLHSQNKSFFSGVDLVVIPSFIPITGGKIDTIKTMVTSVSKESGCAVVVSNGGAGDSSSPYLYRSFTGIFESGETLSFNQSKITSCFTINDLDADVIKAARKRANNLCDLPASTFSTEPLSNKNGLLRPVPRLAFIPQNQEQSKQYLLELYDLQAQSLAIRMQNIGVKKLVLGFSGGVDSTLTALVCRRALDMLKLPPSNLIGITMPGFGTSDRTYFNALSLLDGLGTESREIPIRASVSQHFEDIGHDPANRNTVFENAQARERTQILLDIANAQNGMHVGTGDLSEEALGFCTYCGDHMAAYNVNTCITKTMIRVMIRFIIEANYYPQINDALADILETPVSPELLPPDAEGDMTQKTEDIIGSFELNDFFLYYFINHNMSPIKINFYASYAFADICEPQEITQKLKEFFKRFFAGQFKRACAPDSAMVTDINLASPRYFMPSDCRADLFTQSLDILN